MLFYNILVEQHFFLEMRMLKNMKKKLTVIFASLALCFVSAGCSMDWDPFWTVYTDTWTYDMYKDCFDDTITSGLIKKGNFQKQSGKSINIYSKKELDIFTKKKKYQIGFWFTV